MVTLEWYRSFVAVYQHGTVSGAARRLHMSQPAISQHIAALERNLGSPLFERTAHRLVPLESARRLYTQVVASIERLEAVSLVRGGVGARRLVRLGAPADYFAERLLPHLRLVGTSYEVHLGLPQHLLEMLADGQLDVVVSTVKPGRGGLEFSRLDVESFWLVGGPSIGINETTEAALMAQPWIAYDAGLPIIRRFCRQVFGKRLDFEPLLTVPDLRAVREAVILQRGVSVLPGYICQLAASEGRLQVILTPEPAVTNEIWLAYRKSERQSHAVVELIRIGRTLHGVDDGRGA